MNKVPLILGLLAGIFDLLIGILTILNIAGLSLSPLLPFTYFAIARGILSVIAGILGIVGGVIAKARGGVLLVVGSMISLFGGSVWVVVPYFMLFVGALVAFNETEPKENPATKTAI